MPRTPLFLPCRPPRTEARSTWGPVSGPKVDRGLPGAGAVVLGSGIRTKGRPHALRALSPAPRATRGERACDVPGIFVDERAEVWKLSDPIVTEVRPPLVPVTPPSRKSDLAPSLCRLRHGSPTSHRPCDASPTEGSRPGRLMGVTACQDPHEAPGTPATPSRTAARAWAPGRRIPPPPVRSQPRPSLPRPRPSGTTHLGEFAFIPLSGQFLERAGRRLPRPLTGGPRIAVRQTRLYSYYL